MTRKDFVALAEAIRLIENMVDRARVAELIANVCARSNDNFDRLRFWRACGL